MISWYTAPWISVTAPAATSSTAVFIYRRDSDPALERLARDIQSFHDEVAALRAGDTAGKLAAPPALRAETAPPRCPAAPSPLTRTAWSASLRAWR